MFLRRLSVGWRNEGVMQLARRGWFGFAGAHKFCVYATDTASLRTDAQQDPHFSLEIADAAVIQSLQQNPDFRREEAFIPRLFKYNQCLVGLTDGEPSHLMWVFMPGDFSRFFELRAGQAEINYCVTPERFRGRGMFRKALVAAVRILDRQGVREVLIATHSENVPAMRAIEAAGFRQLGVVRHFGVFYRPKWRTTEPRRLLV